MVKRRVEKLKKLDDHSDDGVIVFQGLDYHVQAPSVFIGVRVENGVKLFLDGRNQGGYVERVQVVFLPDIFRKAVIFNIDQFALVQELEDPCLDLSKASSTSFF